MSEGKVKVRLNGTVMITRHHHCHFQGEGHLVQGVNCRASFLKEEHSDLTGPQIPLCMVANLFQVQSEFTVQSTTLFFSQTTNIKLFPHGTLIEKKSFSVFPKRNFTS